MKFVVKSIVSSIIGGFDNRFVSLFELLIVIGSLFWGFDAGLVSVFDCFGDVDFFEESEGFVGLFLVVFLSLLLLLLLLLILGLVVVVLA